MARCVFKSFSFERRLLVMKLKLPYIASKPQETTHPTLIRCDDVVTTSLSTSQWRHKYVPNETTNDFWMERHQDVSVIRLNEVLLERRNDVSKGRKNDVPSVRLHDVSEKFQMKHPTTSQWYVTKTSQWYVSTTSH